MPYPVETNCEYCKESCTKMAANLSSSLVAIKSRKSFCNKECKAAYNLKHRKDLIKQCEICSSSFRLKSKAHIKKFCSSKCYHKWQSDNVKPPQTENRKVKANSPEAIEKRKKTWEVTGRLFNFRDNKDWKRFYKKCDALTRAMRKEMLPDWDGYDYYDGEYIKQYLELDVHHKNYPTLDHKYPRSKAFQEGMTPQEITTKDNLVWTKRSNNSRKGNKTLNV